MFKNFLNSLIDGHNLTTHEAQEAMNAIMSGEVTSAQIAGFLIALKVKGEVAEEVAGFVKSMRSHSLKLNISDENAVDGCGTGGDGANTFNISTAAALVASSAGVTIAKHGNRSVSSKCGSADLLEALGGNIDPGTKKTEKLINNNKFGFIFAPRFHPAMKHAAVPRKELGVRTVFNILGPMTNPANVKRQVIGVYDKSLMPLMANVLKLTGSEHVIIAHAHDGLDEFSVSSPTDYLELNEGEITAHTISPKDAGLSRHKLKELKGGNAYENVKIIHSLFEGAKNGCRDAVLFNAGAMIYVSARTASIKDGVKTAKEAIDSGKAKEKLNEWIEKSQE